MGRSRGKSDEEPSEPLGDSVLAVRDNDEGQLVVHGGVDAKAELVFAHLEEALALVPEVGTHHARPPLLSTEVRGGPAGWSQGESGRTTAIARLG